MTATWYYMYLQLRKINAGTIIISILALAIGCSTQNPDRSKDGVSSSSSNSTSQKPPVKPSVPPTPAIIYQIGEVILISDRNMNLQFIVNSIREDPGKGVIKPNEGNKWILVNMTIANKGKESKKFSVISFAMMDEQNQSYDVALLAAALEGVETPTGEINPSGQRQGEMAFEVPANAKNLKLLFKPNSSVCETSATDRESLASINCQPIIVKLD